MMKCANKSTFEFTNVYMWAVIALTILGAVAWQLSTFPLMDDWQYSCEVISTEKEDFLNCTGERAETVGNVAQSIINHYSAMNGRLVHILFIPMQILPRYFHSLLAGLCMGLMFLGLLANSNTRFSSPHRFVTVTAAFLLFWCAFPWYDNFQSAIFQLNYSLPSALWLGFLLFLRQADSFTQKRFIFFCIYTFLTGWMHEGFTCVFIAVTFFYGILTRKPLARFGILMLILLLALAVLLAGGTTGRTSEVLAYRIQTNFYVELTSLISQLWPVLIALVLSVFAYIVSGSKKRKELLYTLIPFFTGIAVSIAQSTLLNIFNRGLFPAHLLACVIILQCLNCICDRFHIKSHKYYIIPGLSVIILYAAWITELVRYQIRSTQEWEEILIKTGERDMRTDDVIFADVTQFWNHPWYLMDITAQNICTDEEDNQFFYCFFLRKFCRYLVVLPESLKDKPYEEWPEISGDNDFRGVWPTIVSPAIHKQATVRFGRHLPEVKPSDRILAALKARSIKPDTVEQEMWFGISEVRVPSGDSIQTYFIHIPGFGVRTNERREFLAIDTLETKAPKK